MAEWLDLVPSSLIRVMGQFNDVGLLVRTEDGNDRRVRIIALTEADIGVCQHVLDALGKAVKCYDGSQKQ